MVCDTTTKVEHLLQNMSQTPSLKTIVLLTAVPDNLKDCGQEAGVELMTFEDLVVCRFDSDFRQNEHVHGLRA